MGREALAVDLALPLWPVRSESAAKAAMTVRERSRVVILNS